jgi:hypothetical protein
MEQHDSGHTLSENLFEKYLVEQQMKFQYEKPYPGKAKRVDYTVPIANQDFLFEVKEIEPAKPPRDRSIYVEIRQKITAARRQFKEYKEYPCCLVLFDRDPIRPILECADIVLGSMYGDIWITGARLDKSRARAFGTPRKEFRGGGKMLRPPRNQIFNTRISALITLRYYDSTWSNFVTRAINSLTEPSIEGVTTLEFKFDPSHLRLGVIVWENAYARIPLPRSVFRGPYDIRWGTDNGHQQILFTGSNLPSAGKTA